MSPRGKQDIPYTDMVAVIDYGTDTGLSAPKSQRYYNSVGRHKGYITFKGRTENGEFSLISLAEPLR
jgi:hypothetical protein